jgi:hypothetical protein
MAEDILDDRAYCISSRSSSWKLSPHQVVSPRALMFSGFVCSACEGLLFEYQLDCTKLMAICLYFLFYAGDVFYQETMDNTGR